MFKANCFEVFVLPAVILIALLGCKNELTVQQPAKTTPTPASKPEIPEAPAANSNQSDRAAQSASGFATGRVTMSDGTPLRGDFTDISISISGVSEAAEKVNYTPIVKPDGTYRQKLAPGQYRFDQSTITVNFQNHQFMLPLEPVGSNWRKNQDSADGIEQDFVWKVTGPTPYGQSEGLDPSNVTHWYGMSIGLQADAFRRDLRVRPAPVPDDSVLVFQLKPTSKSIDEQELEPLTVKRRFNKDNPLNWDINDVPPASYELSGTAVMPDGSTKAILLHGKEDRPTYKTTVLITVEKDSRMGRIWKHPLTFVLE